MIGPVQRRVSARRGRAGCVMPANFLERRALRRLAARGLAERVIGFPDLWRIL